VKVAHSPAELEPAGRAIAIGTFDGVHRGHRAVVDAAVGSGLRTAVVTFHPHPRSVLGYEVRLLSSLDRRLELLAEAGADEALVVVFTLELSRLEPEEFVRTVLEPLGAREIYAGEGFRFGSNRRGDLDLLRRMKLDVRPVQPVEGISSSRIRELLREGDIPAAAELLGRPPEVEGVVVAGDQRGGTLGFPTANLAVDHELLVPRYGIYAGAALGVRAAVSIGVNPHYGGQERRIEAFLLDYTGDLYGRRVRLELWKRLRDERAFESEAELVAQIARDVEATRNAAAPVVR
jgi:riboflavin kinase/FMN adenylyltransferase